MRIILKLFAAPFVLALTLLVAALSFCVSLATWAFGVLSSICAICGLFNLFQGNGSQGLYWLVVAFIVSPFGLPAVAGWLVCKLDDLNYSLKSFITN